MDIERFKGQEQPDLPGMPKESKKRRPKINIEKRKPIISGDDIISQKEMREIWNKKMAEKKGIKTLWTEFVFTSGAKGKSNDTITLNSKGDFKIIDEDKNEREIKYDEAKKLIEDNFSSDRGEQILNEIKAIKEKYKLTFKKSAKETGKNKELI